MVRLSVGSVGALCVGVVLGSETRRVGAAYPGPLFLTYLKLIKGFCFSSVFICLLVLVIVQIRVMQTTELFFLWNIDKYSLNCIDWH